MTFLIWLTEAGTQLLGTLAPALAQIGDAVQQAGDFSERPHGLLRINAGYVAYAALIQPRLAAFGEDPRYGHPFTLGDGDIGEHFPPSNPRWKGADSGVFLRHALALIRARGGRLINVDVTLICERPKLSPHRQAMRERLAELLDLPIDRVSVKATTTEAMGFTGRQEGLAAQALAVVQVPA